MALQVFSDVNFIADANIDRDPGVLLLEGKIVTDLPIIR